MTDGTRTIVQVMEAQKVARFIGLATASLADLRDKPHWKHKVLPVMAQLMFPNALAELTGMTKAVRLMPSTSDPHFSRSTPP
ncbi:hypothetical protein ACTWPT_46140 [Nonomuraea sp. 3N208]|uniref:hypothetical protein n=1 Tax=Nonomuraea sp. 3N208 TaxID=3457421 RepID=UPI003FD243BF